MCYTTFSKDDQMLANELMHQVPVPVSALFASLVREEIGEPSFRSPLVTAWYVRAHLGNIELPFALRWLADGSCVAMVSFDRLTDFALCMGYLAPAEIEVIEKPRMARRY